MNDPVWSVTAARLRSTHRLNLLARGVDASMRPCYQSTIENTMNGAGLSGNIFSMQVMQVLVAEMPFQSP